MLNYQSLSPETKLFLHFKGMPLLANFGEPSVRRIAKKWRTTPEQVYLLINKVFGNGTR